MATKNPAILFYTADFLIGTMFMSDTQIGRYAKAICIQHQKGHLTKEQLIGICGGEEDKEVFNKFNVDENGLYYNERMEKEIIKREEFCESRRQSALAKRGKKDKRTLNKRKTYAKRAGSEDGNGNGNKDERNIYQRIFDFWNEKDIIKHKNFPPPKCSRTIFKTAIDNIIKENYSENDIEIAITNYATILQDPKKYFFQYRWTLTEFLCRGFHNFYDWQICNINYQRKGINQKNKYDSKDLKDRAKDRKDRVFGDEPDSDKD